MTAEALTRTVQDLLREAANAVVLEDGAVAFDLGQAKYPISGACNKCLLRRWSAQRNRVRDWCAYNTLWWIGRARTQGRRWYPSAPQRAGLSGACPGITGGASSHASVILAGVSCSRKTAAFPGGASFARASRKPTFCCATSRLRLTGNS